MKRLFVAIEIPKKLRTRISAELTEQLTTVKAIPADNLHITLCFIGDTNDQGQIEIIKRLEKIEFNEFNILIGRVGQFDERVIWVSAEAIELHTLAEYASKSLGVDNEFNGHVTIAKATQSTDFEKEFAKIRNKRINETIKVKSFFLFESKPSPTGSVYSKVSEFKALKKKAKEIKSTE
ncbi:MAG: RNA 2',3'-cyclic phosphodiesterase [archaeon]|jgi:2'-5' RNA ligase